MSDQDKRSSNIMDIPTKKVTVNHPSDMPLDYGTTPGGTIFSTTPGGMFTLYCCFSCSSSNLIM